ncbi:MAG: hypothetical protein U5K00_03520 [Melioribacteraceae bacterium]|nr:hypothetical protein [Melioribacteraceae bacterium]
MQAVIDTEDRERFNSNLKAIDVKFAESRAVNSVDDAVRSK